MPDQNYPMRVILLLLLLVGCQSPSSTTSFRRFIDYKDPTYEQVKDLPRRWEAPTLYVRLPEDVAAGDISIERATALCKEFAIRIYDAFDGQVYVPEFVICNPSVVRERESGMCNLFKIGSLVYHNESYIKDPPLHPGRFYCHIPNLEGDVKYFAGTMLHEWLHTFIGLGDEYKHKGDLGDAINTSCPLDAKVKVDSNSCVMYLSRYNRQLCLPSNHNPNTDQGKEDCYSFAARVLFENRLAFIRVPEKHVPHLNPPTPKIEIRLK